MWPILSVGPGLRAVLYVEADVGAGVVPRALVHRVEYETTPAAAGTVEGARVTVGRQPPPVLGPPLRGGPWVAVYEPSWENGHRRVIYALGGAARIPGRHAIDWIRVDAGGRFVSPSGDEDRIAGWLGQRAEVLAVADAVVAAVRDDVPESARLSAYVAPPLEDATGNYVALDLGEGRHAIYEHLAPGSVRVAPGARVRRGQVIAALGFTGQSTGPHLHLHVADASAPLEGEGAHWVLEAFELRGRYLAVRGVEGGRRPG